ncbi:hypothetical protein BDQ17DRAFT_212312 [Cyathus striatus]|nr:hypothetical protein BDQ17DRAFT_212312 [Cyathus striatus]
MDSPFQHLGTNYVPTVDEAKQIQDLLEISGQKLRCIDTEIDQLQRQLDVLRERRSVMRDFSGRHRALLSPARKLTRDIVEEVFIACLPEDRNPYMSMTETPMLLTRICSLWKRIDLSTPRIWSEIHIVLPNVIKPNWNYIMTQEEELLRQRLDQQQAAVKKWLDRSGSCPLSISVCHTGDSSRLITADAEAYYKTEQKPRLIYQQYIRDTIIPHHQRWYSLDISFPMGTLRGLIEIGLKTEDLKMLKELHITRQAPLSSESMICEWKDTVSLLSFNVTSLHFSTFAPTIRIHILSHHMQAGGGLES